MDAETLNKKIVDLSNDELISLGILGDNVAHGVKVMVDKVRADPEHLGYAAGSPTSPTSPTSPISPTLSDTETLYSQLSNDSEALTVFEMTFWYHGISGNPPPLMWRSDLETNPFPIPEPGANFFNLATKTAHGVFGTQLNPVWDVVAPQILAAIKARGLQYSALCPVRFSTAKDGKETFGPVVVWIAVKPKTTDAVAVRDATPDILHILASAEVTDVVVEWYEGSVERLAGSPLMSVDDNTSARFGLSHPFNTGLGIPIARQSDDAQGTLTFLNGDPSNRILALTNKHVASADKFTGYEFDEADPHHILVCGERRFTRAVDEIEGAVKTGFRNALRLAGELKVLESKPGAQNDRVLSRKRRDLDDQIEANATLHTLSAEVKDEWTNLDSRRFGLVDWAPEISVTVDDRHYTRDIATIAVDGAKLKNFERNIVDLGKQYSADQLEDLFWPVAAVRDDRTIPADLQLPIRRVLPRRLVITPDTEDKNGEPLYIVAKYGNTSDLTLGRYSGMEAYTANDIGVESREVAVFNYSKKSGDFSQPGDSGSLIFTGDGDALAILHSGMPHVTYGTPIWWVVEQILGKYPSAEFCGIAIN
ncbi:hypothetical protein CPB84DRAFT_1813638 [Gymnopilus junonius]|uniref:Uncharacterized protein n=1 Tax=Gymnopilus junonius TaxID=109634 RepID=A0A9P5TQB1_GYMJU|nr:hypothetical protein CPB84DRAFT_1813638 [Gymnopilus junonius]